MLEKLFLLSPPLPVQSLQPLTAERGAEQMTRRGPPGRQRVSQLTDQLICVFNQLISTCDGQQQQLAGSQLLDRAGALHLSLKGTAQLEENNAQAVHVAAAVNLHKKTMVQGLT